MVPRGGVEIKVWQGSISISTSVDKGQQFCW